LYVLQQFRPLELIGKEVICPAVEVVLHTTKRERSYSFQLAVLEDPLLQILA
jgi:hypothetical protein